MRNKKKFGAKEKDSEHQGKSWGGAELGEKDG